MAREYIVMETAMIGLLSPWVFLFFQNRIYMEAAKRMVKKPIVGDCKFSDRHVISALSADR